MIALLKHITKLFYTIIIRLVLIIYTPSYHKIIKSQSRTNKYLNSHFKIYGNLIHITSKLEVARLAKVEIRYISCIFANGDTLYIIMF